MDLAARFAALNCAIVPQGELFGIRRPSGHIVPSGVDIARLERLIVVLERDHKEGAVAESTLDHCRQESVWPQALPKLSNVMARERAKHAKVNYVERATAGTGPH